jgi:hypothetical protein
VVCDGEEEDSSDNDNMADASVVCVGERRTAVITTIWLMPVWCVMVRRRRSSDSDTVPVWCEMWRRMAG